MRKATAPASSGGTPPLHGMQVLSASVLMTQLFRRPLPADVRHLDLRQVRGLRRSHLRVAVIAGAPDGAELRGDLVVGLTRAQRRAQVVSERSEQTGVEQPF